jgi:hypothetical protein
MAPYRVRATHVVRNDGAHLAIVTTVHSGFGKAAVWALPRLYERG